MLPGAIVFFIIGMLNNFSYLLLTILSVIVIFTITYLFFRLGFFGGADVKALLIISFMFAEFALLVLLYALIIYVVFVIIVLYPCLLVRNLSHDASGFLQHPHYFFIGYKTSKQPSHTKLLKKMENCVWVTPQLPFIVFITLGFVITVIVYN